MKRHSKVYFSALFKVSLFLILFSMTQCSGKDDNIKLGFLYVSNATKRYIKESEFFKQKAEELGAVVYIAQGENNDAIQYNKALELFDKGINTLCLIAVNANTAAAIVRAAKDHDVKVIAYNRIIQSKDIDLLISLNTRTLGKYMCNAALKYKPEGNYVILGGDKFDRNAVGLQQSIDSVLKPYVESGKINIMYSSYIESWSKQNATYEFDQAISLTGLVPDVVLGANDRIADGVIEVLNKYNIEDSVLVTGEDTDLAAIKHILKGEQLMTIYHPLKTMAFTAAQAAFDLAQGKSPDKSKITYTDNGLAKIPTLKISSIPIFKNNIDDILIKQGVYTKEEVYN